MNLEHIERHLERRIPALKHLERPYAVLIIAAAVALTLIDGLANHGMSDLVPITTCLYALLVIETYWWPSFSALALVAIAMTAVLVPRIVLPMPVWSLWFVYGMLAYSRRHVMLAVTLALGFAGTVAGVALGRYPLWNMASIVCSTDRSVWPRSQAMRWWSAGAWRKRADWPRRTRACGGMWNWAAGSTIRSRRG
ncbi:hypothetical protein [Bifidobacterium vespertilionis]|uniref:hypothetical protein n=1 Tax=Bifidobacterium vespertilionis TaxID=2562524 RepID=UPI001BDDC62E|nr:hypothetical protein [Bifidobacterium vespertilionis]MBT1178949.1 hypothetical protein [Bifidobacterium vespertilionis]